MLVKDLMAGYNPDKTFNGGLTADDFVLAVDLTSTQDADYGDYAVAQTGVVGLDAQLNPVTDEKQYLRAGNSSQKTGSSRSFKITGDKFVGDLFQDYVLSHKIKFGTGASVVVKYIYFDVMTGTGEEGQVSVIVNSDGSGDAGSSASIDVDLTKYGAQSTEYEWTPA